MKRKKSLVALALALAMIFFLMSPAEYLSVKADGVTRVYDSSGDDVYFVWFVGDATYYYVLPSVVGDNEINFYDVETIAAADGTKYEMGNSEYEFCWKAVEENSVETTFTDYIASSAYTSETSISDRRQNLYEAGFSIDPCVLEPNGNTTIFTNGDMSFRACIYDGGSFEGLRFSQNEDDYTYFPEFMDPTFYTGFVDVGETTADKPAQFTTFMMEPYVIFGKSENSIKDILSVEPLDVPSGAVTVSKNEEDWIISFGSNYFDHVVFKITGADNTAFYVQINRAAFTLEDNFAPEETNPQVIATLYYPENESYTDYTFYAVLTYNDGTQSALQKLSNKTVTLVNTDETGEMEYDGGKGLKMCQAGISVDQQNVASVTFTAVKSSMFSSGSYSGTYAGSEEGTTYILSTRETVY